jgi:NAD(P)-dependent dehydrogenase (short-subunit alcohol dehydrogenase family)
MIEHFTHSLLVAGPPTLTEPLGDSLAGRGIQVERASYDQAVGLLTTSAFDGVALVPTLLSHGAEVGWDTVQFELTNVFRLVQEYIRSSATEGRSGHLFGLVPAESAMGDPADCHGSALAGGVLSLWRTLSLEVVKFNMTANVVLYGGQTDWGDLAGMIHTLMSQDHGTITGQEIYADAGRDGGRLHP